MDYRTPRIEIVQFASQENATNRHIGDWRMRGIEQRVLDKTGSLDLTLCKIARGLGLTPSHIGKRFKTHTGTSFRSFCARKRADYGRELLVTTSMPIKEIAGHLGYRWAGDFGQAFKRIHGMSPRAYRQQKSTTQEMHD